MPAQTRAVACTCPACGVGESTGLCTLTREPGDPGADLLGLRATVYCDACRYWLQDGIVLARGVALDPEDVRMLAGARTSNELESSYLAPESRPLRLVPTYVWDLASTAVGTEPRRLTSITLHFGRVRGRESQA